MREVDLFKSVVTSTSTPPTNVSDWTRFYREVPQTPAVASSTSESPAKSRSLSGKKRYQYATFLRPTSLVALTPAQQAEVYEENVSELFSKEENETPLSKRAYPHIVDSAQPALALVAHVLSRARVALECLNESDIQGVASNLKTVAVGCATIHPLTTFNESYGAVISHIRRSCLLADADQIDLGMLSALLQALSRLADDPLLGLSSAADMVDMLQDNGWRGDFDPAEILVARILESDITPVKANPTS